MWSINIENRSTTTQLRRGLLQQISTNRSWSDFIILITFFSFIIADNLEEELKAFIEWELKKRAYGDYSECQSQTNGCQDNDKGLSSDHAECRLDENGDYYNCFCVEGYQQTDGVCVQETNSNRNLSKHRDKIVFQFLIYTFIF